jgi:16S rRNA (guanine1516-N2)-methyltransferase
MKLATIEGRLNLISPDDPDFTPFHIDFLSGKMLYRSRQASIKKEMLARALGKKPKDHPYIVDATAGLGRDSFILASLGFNVTMLERSPILFALLEDALQRACHDNLTAESAARLNLIQADAKDWLTQLPAGKRPDIVYLDPMFPEREKSASVKKEMVILQQLLGNEADAAELLTIALSCSNQRVVVKRPRLAPALSRREATFTLIGKSSRFDVYQV